MKKLRFDKEKDGFYGTYWSCKDGSDCGMIAVLGAYGPGSSKVASYTGAECDDYVTGKEGQRISQLSAGICGKGDPVVKVPP